MEQQDILNAETGTKESTNLKPAVVKIASVETRAVGDKGNLKLACKVKHPDKEELIEISSVKYEFKNKLQSVGLWVNLDEDKKIRKGCALATLMAYVGANNPNALVGKDCNTAEDDKGFLTFKAY